MSRLGKSLVTGTELLDLDELIERDRRGLGRTTSASSAASSCARRPALGGRDRAERGAVPGRRRSGSIPRSSAARGVRILLFGRRGKVGSVLGPRSRRPGTSSSRSTEGARGARRLHARPTPRGERSGRASRPAFPASSARPAWTDERGRRARASARAAGLLRAELRARRRADDAVRGRGGRAAAARRDRRAPPRDEARRALRHGEGDGRADGRRRADPLRPPAGPRRAPGGDLRRAGARR